MNEQTEGEVDGQVMRAALALMSATMIELMDGQRATRSMPEEVRRAAWSALVKPVQVAVEVFTRVVGRVSLGEVLPWLEEFAKKNAAEGEETPHARLSRLLVEFVRERMTGPAGTRS